RFCTSDSSSPTAQLRRRSAMRFAISAAAARVKVRHRIPVGLAPVSNRRSTRSPSTWVFPDPAEAATQAQTVGSEARNCSEVAARTDGRVGRIGTMSAKLARLFVGLVHRPFCDSREMFVVVVARRIFRTRLRRVGGAVLAEGAQQIDQPLACAGGQFISIDRAGAAAGLAHFLDLAGDSATGEPPIFEPRDLTVGKTREA